MEKLKLANRSRKNRIFYDFLILYLAVELNLGTKAINRDELMPTYVSHAHAGDVRNDEYYVQITRNSGCIYRPCHEILSKKMLDQLDAILAEAPLELNHCGSRKMITDYLSLRTDLTDCHFVVLNQATSIR